MLYSFESLEVWKRSIILAKNIYILTRKFPKYEQFGLISQVRRAAISVPSNIAEGCGRDTKKQLLYFLSISSASLCEIETQIYLAYELDYITNQSLGSINSEVVEVRKMINGFRKYVQGR